MNTFRELPKDCLSCVNSFSEEGTGENGTDKLFCMVKQQFVDDNHLCKDYN